ISAEGKVDKNVDKPVRLHGSFPLTVCEQQFISCLLRKAINQLFHCFFHFDSAECHRRKLINFLTGSSCFGRESLQLIGRNLPSIVACDCNK
ncbi:hypothetical protein PMAYCL1PPCAC_08097, partial [Pristionchus mayeri]